MTSRPYLRVENSTCRGAVTHMPSPDKKEIDRALGAVPVLHGYIFIVYELVDVPGQEADKAAAIELFPVHCHGELVRASVDDYMVHFFSLLGVYARPLATLETEARIGLRLILWSFTQ